MGKDLKRSILNKVVKPHNNKSFGTVKAKVVNFDNLRNRVDIEFQEPRSTGKMLLEKVPVQIGSIGVQSASIQKGEYVWVSFINNSPLMPKVIGLADERYETNTREKMRHLRQGSLNPKIKDEIVEPSEPLSEGLLDSENTNYSKHLPFISHNIQDRIKDFRQNIGYYGLNETGITHHLNNSTVKIKDDGTIDILTETNHGISIDPNNATILINSNEDINVKTETINFKGKSSKVECNNAEAIIDNWIIRCNSLSIESNKISIKGSEEIIIESPSIVVKGEVRKE